jgi:hypothetical protein
MKWMKENQYTSIYKKIIYLAYCFLLIGQQSTFALETPNVLIDLSHEFTFKFDADLPYKYLEPAGYDYTRYLATLETKSLDGYDIVVISQFVSGVSFSSDLLQGIKKFVEKGGGLLLIGKGWVWPSYYSGYPKATNYPLNDLSIIFGATFTTSYATDLYTIEQHEITEGVTSIDNQGSTSGTLVIDGNWTSIASDSKGNAIMAIRNYGNGRVFISAEDNIFGNPAKNVVLISNIFKYLSHDKQTRYPGYKPVQRIKPELSKTLNHVTIRYAYSLDERYQYIGNCFEDVYKKLKAITTIEPVYDLELLCLATGGGGYSGGQEIGVGILTNDHYLVSVLAHELAHSWNEPGNFPSAAFEEGWAELMAIRVEGQMGFHIEAESERAEYEKQFRRLDQIGNKLDLRINFEGLSYDDKHSYMGKTMWVFETLETKFDNNFMARLLSLHREYVQKGIYSNPITMENFTDMIEIVAGADLTEYFKSIALEQ